MISVVIPAYNEAAGIGDFLDSLRSFVDDQPEIEDIIVVNDGSTDDTPAIISQYDVRLVEHRQNKGYGASLKTGIRAASEDYVLITDADGTYPVDAIGNLVDHIDTYDMVVGARVGDNVEIPTYRRPAKWFLSSLANYLTDSPIPDLNSGLRVFRKEDAKEFFHILPSGFSFTTTITLIYLTSDRLVHYVPINYHDRDGDSKIKPIQDGLNFIVLIIRTMTYFKPLRVYLPVGIFLMIASLGTFVYTNMLLDEFMDVTTILLAIAGIQTVLYGLLADLVVRRN